MQRRTRTDFLIEAALEKAEQVIAEQTTIRLPLRDQELLAEALQNQASLKPPPFLKKLANEYVERVKIS